MRRCPTPRRREAGGAARFAAATRFADAVGFTGAASLTTAARLAAALLACILAAACHEGPADAAIAVPGGDPEVGRRLLDNYGCGECHVIPGVPGADSWAGPPLTEWAARRLIAGALPNTPENLMRFIMDPDSIEPGTAMPDLGVDDVAARHMAAYLFTLELENPLGPPHPLPLRWLESLLPTGARH